MLEENLDQIGRRNATDNSSLCHDYLRVLEPYFEPLRNKSFNMIELGVAGGNSLKTWRDYFWNADILGVDHNPEVEKLRIDGARTLCADVTFEDGGWHRIREYLKMAEMTPLTLCFDDASHTVWAGYQAFIKGWPLLVAGGLWVISDTHASYDAAYRRDNERNGIPEAITIMDVIFRESGRRLHEFGDSQCGNRTMPESDIEFVHYYKSLIVIKKRLTKGAEDAP